METVVEGLVSVIVPVYNRADIVSRTIESILAQSYQNFEVIAVNDGSSDASLDVLNSYALSHPGKVVVLNQQNTGQARARNNGIKLSKGEFIAFLDSDDTWEKDKLSLQMPLFKKKVGLVYCGIYEVDSQNNKLKSVLCEPGMRGNVYKRLLVKNRMTGGSVVVSREALNKAGFFDVTLDAAENWDLWIRISREFLVDYIDLPLVNYLRHPGNMSCDMERMSRSSWAVLQKHLPPDEKKGVLATAYDEAYANYFYNIGVLSFSHGDYQRARSMFRQCWNYHLFYRDSLLRMFRVVLGGKVNRAISNFKSRIVGQN